MIGKFKISFISGRFSGSFSIIKDIIYLKNNNLLANSTTRGAEKFEYSLLKLLST
jgi:hypothetical protein